MVTGRWSRQHIPRSLATSLEENKNSECSKHGSTLDCHIGVHLLQLRRHKCVNSRPKQTTIPTAHSLTEASNWATRTTLGSTTANSPINPNDRIYSLYLSHLITSTSNQFLILRITSHIQTHHQDDPVHGTQWCIASQVSRMQSIRSADISETASRDTASRHRSSWTLLTRCRGGLFQSESMVQTDLWMSGWTKCAWRQKISTH